MTNAGATATRSPVIGARVDPRGPDGQVGLRPGDRDRPAGPEPPPGRHIPLDRVPAGARPGPGEIPGKVRVEQVEVESQQQPDDPKPRLE